MNTLERRVLAAMCDVAEQFERSDGHAVVVADLDVAVFIADSLGGLASSWIHPARDGLVFLDVTFDKSVLVERPATSPDTYSA